jgi:hypothetical protein
MAEHAYRTIMESSEFNRLVIAQGWLDEEDRWDGVLAHCEDERLRESLRREFKEFVLC